MHRYSAEEPTQGAYVVPLTKVTTDMPQMNVAGKVDVCPLQDPAHDESDEQRVARPVTPGAYFRPKSIGVPTSVPFSTRRRRTSHQRGT